MTIEELKERLEDAYMAGETLASLRFEILALVEACNGMETTWKASAFIARSKALAAFNAKLEAL